LHFLEVADDGAGLRHDVNPRTDHSLGLRLIRSLTQQLDGVFDITNAQPGTVARLRLALTDHANAQ
jgi:two-component sensor histidine kinase